MNWHLIASKTGPLDASVAGFWSTTNRLPGIYAAPSQIWRALPGQSSSTKLLSPLPEKLTLHEE